MFHVVHVYCKHMAPFDNRWTTMATSEVYYDKTIVKQQGALIRALGTIENQRGSCRAHTLQSTCPIWTGETSVNKPATIKQVYPHFVAWIKPANVIKVIGKSQNLHYVCWELLILRRFQKNFSHNRKLTSDLPTSGRLYKLPLTCITLAVWIQTKKCG